MVSPLALPLSYSWGQLTYLPQMVSEGRRASLTCLCQHPADKRQKQLSGAHTLGACSPATHTSRASPTTVLPRQGAEPAFPVASAVGGQDQLSHSHGPRAISPSCCSKWQGIRVRDTSAWQTRGVLQLSHTHSLLDGSPTTPISRASSIVLPR